MHTIDLTVSTENIASPNDLYDLWAIDLNKVFIPIGSKFFSIVSIQSGGYTATSQDTQLLIVSPFTSDRPPIGFWR
jgi:hypothetical protein